MSSPLEGRFFPICGRGAIPLPDAVETYSGYNRPAMHGLQHADEARRSKGGSLLGKGRHGRV